VTLPPLREVIARHGLSASKALGQNFLLDEQLLDRIAAIPVDLADRAVLEIGPGPGGLTRALLRAGARVTAIEMDRRCLPALGELAEAFPGRLRVIEGDALALDHDALMAGPYAVVANLPYNVGTALFVRWTRASAPRPIRSVRPASRSALRTRPWNSGLEYCINARCRRFSRMVVGV
jgi:16S rRNA (adenine1518-N6/adenine1519-N6)-dimethyltransferase